MTEQGVEHNLGEIRELLTTAFTAEDLRRFCMDRPVLRPIIDRFGPRHGLNDMVDVVIDYCRTQLVWHELLTEVQRARPRQYARFHSSLGDAAPQLEPDPGQSAGPEEQVSAGDTRPRRMTHGARFARPAETQPDRQTGPIRNRWALLVGVDKFVDPTFAPLKFCVNDVLALGEVLEGQGYTVVTLHDNAPDERLSPSRDNVEAELTRLARVAGPDDLLWAHFACHGTLVEGKPVLVTRDTRRELLARRALPLADVQAAMRQSEARRLVLTLDACHVGAKVRGDLADPAFIHNVYETAEGFALLAASTSQQVAQEWADKQHGVFSYFLLDGLSGKADRTGKGYVTVSDLHAHTLDGLRRWSVTTGQRIQEPTFRTEGMGDMILAVHDHVPDTSDRAPQAEPKWKQIGIEMVRIPAGDFLYGGDKHPVHLEQYYIGRTPVTNAQYRAFLDASLRRPPSFWKGGHFPPGKEDHPAVYVTWQDAQAFCWWAGGRLPTEQEWEKAARGTDGRKYPWGDDWVGGRCNSREAKIKDTTPVDRYPEGASPFGLLDVAGNVSEWCDDSYEQYRVLRGGSWTDNRENIRCTIRRGLPPLFLRKDLGFRLVVDSVAPDL